MTRGPRGQGRPLDQSRVEVLGVLALNGGVVASDVGHVTSAIADVLNRRADGLAGLLKDMEVDGQIMRDVRGRRTFEIVVGDVDPALMARAATWADEVRAFAAPTDADDALALREGREARTAPIYPVEAAAGPPDVDDGAPSADDVAAAILRKVAELVDLDVENLVPAERMEEAIRRANEFSERLALTLEENQRTRTRLRDVQDELVATKAERDHLRKVVHQLEENVHAAIRNQASIVDGEVRQRLDRFMRQTPTTKGDT